MLTDGWVSGKALQRALRVSPSSVQRYLNKLVESGHEVVRRGPRSATEYTVLIQEDFSDLEADLRYWKDRCRRLESQIDDMGGKPYAD